MDGHDGGAKFIAQGRKDDIGDIRFRRGSNSRAKDDRRRIGFIYQQGAGPVRPDAAGDAGQPELGTLALVCYGSGRMVPAGRDQRVVGLIVRAEP